MSADLLREAAALMRQRAEASMPFVRSEGWWTIGGLTNAFTAYGGVHGAQEDAEHIAAWHPAVALAVATWLESEADTSVALPEWFENCPESLAVARAYLGRPA